MDKKFEAALNKFEFTVKEIKEQNEYLNVAGWYASEGNDIVYPQLKAKWTDFVRESITNKSIRLCMEDIVKIMKTLDSNKDLNKALNIISHGDYSGAAYGLILNTVADFSKRGTEFAKAALGKDCNSNWVNYFKDIEERNAKFESQLNDDKEIE